MKNMYFVSLFCIEHTLHTWSQVSSCLIWETYYAGLQFDMGGVGPGGGGVLGQVSDRLFPRPIWHSGTGTGQAAMLWRNVSIDRWLVTASFRRLPTGVTE